MDIDVEGDSITTETYLTIDYEAIETPVPEIPVSNAEE